MNAADRTPVIVPSSAHIVELGSLHEPFHTLAPGAGSTEAEPRFMVVRHAGFAPPCTVGFVFRRKSGRWGAAVMPANGGPICHDIPRLSVANRENAVSALVIEYLMARA